MADDLIEVAEETQKAMVELERRAHELHQNTTKLIGEARDHTKDLALDEGKFNTHFDTISKHLGNLQAKLAQAGDEVAGRIGNQIKEVERQSKDLDSKHVGVRKHLKDLRDAVTNISNDVETLRKDTHKALNLISGESGTLLTATVKVLDRTEEAMRTVTLVKVTGITTSVAARAKQLHNHVETVLGPRVDQDAIRFSERITTLSGRLAGLLSKAQSQTLKNSQTRLGHFERTSATDWRGGSGTVDATSRSGDLKLLGENKSAAIAGEVATLLGLASNFQETINSIRTQYSTVFSVPGQIQSVARRV